MSLKGLFGFLTKNDQHTALKKSVSKMESELSLLKERVLDFEEKISQQNEHTKEGPIIIERINIEKIILDKYELNNHFGQLGIKELKGRLNIGATYGSEFSPKVEEEEEEKKIIPKKKNYLHEKVPKINIHSKSEE